MKTHGVFPFGQPVMEVVQRDRSPKSVFILGVYGSAVHARWEGADGKTLVKALAVASEPEIFWDGKEAEKIIETIRIPAGVGRLLPLEDKRLNGPSGNTLDKCILEDLGLNRNQVWLCDLIPYSRMNSRQKTAVDRAYKPLINLFHLPKPNLELADEKYDYNGRLEGVAAEFKASGARTLILLGDQPIRHFLYPVLHQQRKLSDFGDAASLYGRLHPVNLFGNDINVLPLAHPRQIAGLGQSSPKWQRYHTKWRSATAIAIRKEL